MPEGDTIHRTARRMRPALAGHTLTRFEAPRLVGARPQVGEAIEDVEAQGKHLLVHFSGGLSLRTHMKMNGSWHLYRDGEKWRKPPHLARAVVGASNGWLGVCFQAPVVETYHRSAPLPDALRQLGPDLTRPGVDLDAVVERALLAPPTNDVADVLLDQRVAAGIGNVYKSDLCWLHRIHPQSPAASIERAQWRAIYEQASELLIMNLQRTRRATYRDGLAVYGRSGQSCFRCGAVIAMRRTGEHARTTYFCPDCQELRLS